MLGYTVLLNMLFTLFLAHLNRKPSHSVIKLPNSKFPTLPNLSKHQVKTQLQEGHTFVIVSTALGRQQAVVSKEELQERDKRRKAQSVVIELREYLQHSGSINGW